MDPNPKGFSQRSSSALGKAGNCSHPGFSKKTSGWEQIPGNARNSRDAAEPSGKAGIAPENPEVFSSWMSEFQGIAGNSLWECGTGGFSRKNLGFAGLWPSLGSPFPNSWNSWNFYPVLSHFFPGFFFPCQAAPPREFLGQFPGSCGIQGEGKSQWEFPTLGGSIPDSEFPESREKQLPNSAIPKESPGASNVGKPQEFRRNSMEIEARLDFPGVNSIPVNSEFPIKAGKSMEFPWELAGMRWIRLKEIRECRDLGSGNCGYSQISRVYSQKKKIPLQDFGKRDGFPGIPWEWALPLSRDAALG